METDFVYKNSVLGNSGNIIEDKGNSADHRTLTNTSSINEDRETDTDSIEDHTDMRTSSNDLATEGSTPDSSMMEDLDIEVLTYKEFSFPIALYKSMVNLELNKTSLLYTITHSLHSPQYQGLQPKSALFLHMLWIKKLLSLMNTRSKKDEFMKEDRPLADFGIKKLEFEITVKDMHRVFNPYNIESIKISQEHKRLFNTENLLTMILKRGIIDKLLDIIRDLGISKKAFPRDFDKYYKRISLARVHIKTKSYEKYKTSLINRHQRGIKFQNKNKSVWDKII